MERTTTVGGNYAGGGNSPNLTNPKIEGATQAAHQATDKVADKATAQVDRLSGTAHEATDKVADKATAQVDRLSATAHRAIDGAGSAASSAAEWASTIPEQAKQMQAEFVESASASIRARPIATVAGALVIGSLLGRLARW